MTDGIAGFTLLFFLFIAVFGIVSLVSNSFFFLLLPMFGLALGLFRKGGDVNVGSIESLIWNEESTDRSRKRQILFTLG